MIEVEGFFEKFIYAGYFFQDIPFRVIVLLCFFFCLSVVDG